MKIPAWKSAFSYVFPVLVAEYTSSVSGRIRIWLTRGKLVLDSPQANYSFGALHQVFREVFAETGFHEFPSGRMLLLGLGGGSVPTLIYGEMQLNLPITAVEVDPMMIRLAKEYFGAAHRPLLEIVEQDARIYVRQADQKFSTIVVDMFIDNEVPDDFATPVFLEQLHKLAEPDGRIYFNMITTDEAQRKKCEQVRFVMQSWAGVVNEYPVMYANTVLFWQGR